MDRLAWLGQPDPPGASLMLALSDVVLEQNANCCVKGTSWWIGPMEGDQPWLLFLLTHEIKAVMAQSSPSAFSSCA